MQQRLYRVRDRKIGKMPRGREHFNPKELLKRLHGRKGEKVVILDSNNLDDGWEEKIMKTNPNSAYKWDNFSEEMKEYEDSEGNDDENSGQDEKQDVSIDEGISETEEVTVEDLGPEEDTEKTDNNENKKETSKENKKLPKRVLAYSTEELLKLFELAERSSVDGTFKSICKLWKQQFILMLKVKGTVTGKKACDSKVNSKDRNEVIKENEGNNDISSWNNHDDSNILDITKDGNDPYSERQVGVSKKRQEREVNRESRWWIKEKCKSCGKGFRPNSKVNKCHACDRYTHIKKPCTTSNKDGTNFYCVKCKEVEKDAATYEETLDSRNFQCQLCKFSFNHKRNLIRHMKQQHANPIGTTQKEFDMEEEKDEPIVETIL